jgi:hypothetical protein
MVNEPALTLLSRASAALSLLAVAACRPDAEVGPSLLDGPRVLAIRSTPAEVEPGKPVSYSDLYATPEGDSSARGLEWSLCTARKPIAVSGPIALECLTPSGPGLVSLGTGPSVNATMPADGCRVFGPSPPAPKAGERAARPADPDSTGGYFQPLRVRVPEGQTEYAIGFTRLLCGPGAATQEQSLEFAATYRPNENPELGSVIVNPDGESSPLADSPQAPSVLRAGEKVTLRVSWAECSATTTCTGSESYPYLDPIARQLITRREALRVSWFASAGSFAHDRSGRTEAEAEAGFIYSDNDWTAPDEAGEVRVWVVLRDDRGGVGYRSFFVNVQ